MEKKICLIGGDIMNKYGLLLVAHISQSVDRSGGLLIEAHGNLRGVLRYLNSFFFKTQAEKNDFLRFFEICFHVQIIERQ
jgi:hypothetical protein